MPQPFLLALLLTYPVLLFMSLVFGGIVKALFNPVPPKETLAIWLGIMTVIALVIAFRFVYRRFRYAASERLARMQWKIVMQAFIMDGAIMGAGAFEGAAFWGCLIVAITSGSGLVLSLLVYPVVNQPDDHLEMIAAIRAKTGLNLYRLAQRLRQ